MTNFDSPVAVKRESGGPGLPDLLKSRPGGKMHDIYRRFPRGAGKVKQPADRLCFRFRSSVIAKPDAEKSTFPDCMAGRMPSKLITTISIP